MRAPETTPTPHPVLRYRRPERYKRSEHGEVAVAQALYENESDWPDELAFKKGDLLRVLDENPGVEKDPTDENGWWFCVNEKGNKGFAPANRLQIMHRFDRGFFQVANPLFEDFFMFNGPDRHPFAEPFFDQPTRIFTPRHDERVAADVPQPIRRLQTINDSFAGVVRNIPIRVEQPNNEERFGTLPRRESTDTGKQTDVRRTFSTEQLSPPVPPTRKYFNLAPPTNGTTPTSVTSSHSTTPTQLPSSSDEDELTARFGPGPLRENPEPSRISQEKQNPIKSINNGPELSSMDKLANRLQNLGNAQYREPVIERTIPVTTVGERSASPSSSGIGADATDSSHSDEPQKRSSDISTISSSSCDPNGSLSDNTTDDSGHGSSRLQPAPPTRATFSQSGSISRPGRSSDATVIPADGIPSTSVLQTVFDNIDRSPQNQPTTVRHVPIIQKDTPPPRHQSISEWKLPIRVEEDIEKNKSPLWNQIPTRVEEPTALPQPKPVRQERGDFINEDPFARKRVVVAQMEGCVRAIEHAVTQLRKGTAPQHWRQPHVLQMNLGPIRDACVTIHENLDAFVESTGRISIDRTHPKAEELRRLITPLRETRNRICSLRRQLDTAGWKLVVLARDKDQPRAGVDNLEQFIHIAKEAPAECHVLVDWVYALAPSPSVVFLSHGGQGAGSLAKAQQQYPGPLPQREEVPRPTQASLYLQPVAEEKRHSTSSTSTITSGDSSSAGSSNSGGPSSILVTGPSDQRSQRGRVTFADETPDPRPLATTTPEKPTTRVASNGYGTIERRKPNGYPPLMQNQNTDTAAAVIEEDDLESVISDRDSLYQDYAYLDDVVPGRINQQQRTPSIHLSEDDQELVRFYAPQIHQHTDALSDAIEEIFTVVEQHRPPREFVQKGKLIILAAHKLVYIGDTVSQCLKDPQLSAISRRAADRLCGLLENCVTHTKMAADEYPDVTCMKSMVDSIMDVSKAAQQLKHTITDCL